MKLYAVTLPIAGTVTVEVCAESEGDAIDKAMGVEITSDHINEWEAYRKLAEGNVLYVWHSSAEADEIGDCED